MTNYGFGTDGIFGMKKIKYLNKIVSAALVLVLVLGLALPTAATGVLISSDPSGGSCTVGESAPTLMVSAAPASGGVLTYQWYDAYGAPIPGATGASFAPPSNTAGEFGYYVVVTESVEGTVVASDTSNLATVKVTRDAEKPKITANPSSASCTVGQTVTLYANAEVATGTLSYRWFCYTSESAVGGATEIYTASSPSYSPPTDKASSVYYYCRITNTDPTANGETKVSVNTSTALVTVRNSGDAEAPVIYSQPAPLDATIGDEAQISVGATVSDGGDISYQWYSCLDQAGSEAVPIEGETTAYFRPSTDEETTMYVYCELTNTNTTVTGSQTATALSDVVLFRVRKPDIVGAVWDGGSSGRFAGGRGTEGDPFVIETAGQLGYFSEFVQGEDGLSGRYFALGEDIILNDGQTENLWIPVDFEGVFDGRGHSITGLKVENADCAGLFGHVKDSRIYNLSVSGEVSGKAAGGICGAAENSVIENSLFTGSVSGSVCSGGIVGTVFGGAVTNCLSPGMSPAGAEAGYALTDMSFDSAEGMTVLSKRARAKAGLALWTMDANGVPGLTAQLSAGDDEDVFCGDLSAQSGISGSNAIAQLSARGTLNGDTLSLWVDPAELSVLMAEVGKLKAENGSLSIYVYIDCGDAVLWGGETGVELILSEKETELLSCAGSVWESSIENGVPTWRQAVAGEGTALTADLGDINATWSAKSLSEAVGAGIIHAEFTSAGKNELAAVDLGGYTNGTWRVKAESFGTRTELAAVIITSGGFSRYTVAVNSGGFAEFTVKGFSGDYLFFDRDGVPQEFIEIEEEEPPAVEDPEAPVDPTKPVPKKGATAMVAVCAVAVSVGGALIYGMVSGGLGKKKK